MHLHTVYMLLYTKDLQVNLHTMIARHMLVLLLIRLLCYLLCTSSCHFSHRLVGTNLV